MHKILSLLGKQSIKLNPSCSINERGELMLYGAVGDWYEGMSALDIVEAVASFNPSQQIVVRIQSDGGSVAAGLSMYNELKKHSHRLVVYVDGVAASMACIISMASKDRRIYKNAFMHMHKCKSWFEGFANAVQLREGAEQLELWERACVSILAEGTGKTVEQINAEMADGKDHIYLGQEAVDFGLATSIVDEEYEGGVQASFGSNEVKAALKTLGYVNQPEKKPAAAAAKQNQQEPRAMFKLKTKNGGQVYAAFTLLAAAALMDAYANVSEAVAGLKIEGLDEEALTGKRELAPAEIKALALALDVSAPVEPAAPAAPVSQPEASLSMSHIKQLTAIAASASVGNDVLQGWLEGGVTVQEAQAKALDLVVERSQEGMPTGGALRTHGATSAAPEAFAHALLVNNAPARYQHTEDSRNFEGRDAIDSICAYLESQGERTRGKSRREIVAMAMTSTSDIPLVLENVANKELIAGYDEEELTYTAWSKKGYAKDFKNKKVVRLDMDAELKKKNENGEFERSKFVEEGNGHSVVQYGTEVAVTFETLVNDDLGAVLESMRGFGQLVRGLESDRMYANLLSTVKFDGKNVFNAAANTQIAGDGDLESALEKMFLAMRLQKSLGGRALNLKPSLLLVSPERHLEAMKLMSAVMATKSGDVNVFANSLKVETDSRLAGQENNPFHLFADPNKAPIFEYTYLQGEEKPYIESEVPFGTRGLRMVVSHIFGEGVVGNRGAVYNPGA